MLFKPLSRSILARNSVTNISRTLITSPNSNIAIMGSAALADKTYKLNNGTTIPAFGLGTWQSPAGEVQKAVSYALQHGYKHIDGAYCYANEDEVGAGLKEAFAAGVKREDVFVTSKLWCTYHTRVAEGLEKSLKSLGLDYVDLFLMHWPVTMNANGNHDRFPTRPDGSRDIIPRTEWDHTQTWAELEKLVETGKVKAIGVSNYSKRYLEELLPKAKIVPAVNQIENHPALPQQEIVDFCKEKGILITAYSPLGSTGSPLFKSEPVLKIAEKKSVTPAAVLLSYHLARGSAVLAKSVTPARISQNIESLVALDEEELAELKAYSDKLAKDGKLERYVYPAFGVDFGFPDKS